LTEISKFPLGQKFKILEYKFIFTRKYNRNRYKVKLLENSKLDFNNYEFSAGFTTFKFVKKIDDKTYMVKETKK